MNGSIAVVGLGCVLPGARDPGQFWRKQIDGWTAIRPLSDDVYEWRRYVDPDGSADHAYTMLGATIGPYDFDWRRFRMPPADLATINPLQLLVLDAGTQALSAVRELPRDRTGLFIGSTGLGWQRDSGLRIRLHEMEAAAERSPAFAALPAETRRAILAATRRALDARLKPVTDDNVVGASASVALGRIAMHLDLRGLHYAVDAGFASSLVALDVAVRALRDGSVDVALAGGVSELLTPLELVVFSKFGGLSRRQLRVFDADSDGTLLGEGAVAFALMRLDDAERSGQTIHAVIRGVGTSTDGPGKSLLAPLSDGQALAMRRAYADAQVEPASIGYVECHATGTVVGDASEIRALSQVFEGVGAGEIAIASAKPFVGHLRAGAGAVGLLRAVLALEHGQVPRQIGFERAHPALELERSPFFVPTAHTPLQPRGAPAARAAVSAFGFGGINAHAVLEAYVPGAPFPRLPPPPAPEPIAIVGMGCVLPGADNVAAFWQSLLSGYDATTEIPNDRWDIDRFFDPDPTRQDTTYARHGCFLQRLPQVEDRWKIPPNARPSIDPGQLLVLLATEEALAQAGYAADRWDPDRVGVMLAFLPYQGKKFLADIRVNYAEYRAELSRALAEAGTPQSDVIRIADDAEASFKAGLPPISEDTITGYLGSINAARVAKRYGFRGPHFVVDSACASTHAALHAALQALRQGSCDVVLSGGVWADMQPEFFIAACRFNALSPTGITPFDARASGFIPGEGAGVVVLKRLGDAVRDGDQILAVIRSVEGSSDGRGRSVLAPSPEGESLAMTRALEAAGVDPSLVDFVECHGTGTALGDVVEVDACLRAYGTSRQRPLRIGSVKSNIGHLNAAAGVPALIKTVLALREGVLPPSLKVERPNPQIDFARGPVQVVTTRETWERPHERPRLAGISGFGVGGSNMHMIVEEFMAGSPAVSGKAMPSSEDRQPLLVAAAGGATVREAVARIADLARRADLDDAGAFREALRASQEQCDLEAPARVAIEAPSRSELRRKVELLAAAEPSQAARVALSRQGIFAAVRSPNDRVALTFPGQGSQYANMLRDASARFPALAAHLRECDAVYERIAGRPLSASFFTDDPEAWRQRDEDIHCAVFAVNTGLQRLLALHGLRPDVLIGQSAGEYSALVAAGALSLDDGLLAVRERTLSVLELESEDPGRMLLLACGAGQARDLIASLPGYAALAADNSPTSCIVSADRAALPVVEARCVAAGIEATPLAVSHGYHSELIAGAIPRFRGVLSKIAFSAPSIEVISTITGTSIAPLPTAALPDLLASQFRMPVALRSAFEEAYAGGVRIFVECGPGWPLTTFVGETLGARPHLSQATVHPKVGEVAQFSRAVAALFVHGRANLGAFTRETIPVASTPVDAIPPIPVHSGPATPSGEPEPLPADLVTLLTGIRDLIDGFLARRAAPDARPAAPSPPPQAPTRTASAPSPATQAVPAAPAAPSLTATDERWRRVHAMLIDELVARTGYPAEMLDLDLDLEGELGIDTVKQVAVLAEVRSKLGLERDPEFRLRDHLTLRAWTNHLALRLAAPATPTPASSPTQVVDVDRVRDAFLAAAVERTGYPPEMLELDLDMEADLGIDTVKQIALIAQARSSLGLEQDPQFRLRDHPTPRHVIEYLRKRLATESPATATMAQDSAVRSPTERPVVRPAALHERPSAAITSADPFGELAASWLASVRGLARDGADLPVALRAALSSLAVNGGESGLTSPGQDGRYARALQCVSLAFDELVGVIALADDVAADETATLAGVLEGAFALARQTYFELVGRDLAFAGVVSIDAYRPPPVRAPLLVHVRFAAGPGGNPHFDVTVTDGALSVIARACLRGAPTGSSAGALARDGGPPTDAWRTRARRVHVPRAEPGSHP